MKRGAVGPGRHRAARGSALTVTTDTQPGAPSR